MKPCDEILLKTIEMASSMLKLADEGDANREDNGCGVLYGLVRDCAYKIKRLAETEKEAHIRNASSGDLIQWNKDKKGDL
ncbi:MAG: hypothetical protein R6U13_05265 [Desulfatiglandaceae bacterium]